MTGQCYSDQSPCTKVSTGQWYFDRSPCTKVSTGLFRITLSCFLSLSLIVAAVAEETPSPEPVPPAAEDTTGETEPADAENATGETKPGEADDQPVETEEKSDKPATPATEGAANDAPATLPPLVVPPLGEDPAPLMLPEPEGEKPQPVAPKTAEAKPLPSKGQETPTAEAATTLDPKASKEPAKLPEVPATEATSKPAMPVKTAATEPQLLPMVVTESTELYADAEFVDLLNEGLNGWKVMDGKDDAWVVNDGVLSCVSYGGGWLRTEKEYSDFVMRVEYRLQEGGNTGIGLRCPEVGNPTFTGIEVQLLDDASPKYANLRPAQYTGSVYYRVAPQQKAELNAAGEWNTCEITCIGDDLTIKINDVVVNQVSLLDNKSADNPQFALAQRPPVGHIALQSHTSRIDFRNVQVKDVSVRTGSGLQYVDLNRGAGDEVPQTATVTVHYAGQLASGKRFSNSRDLGNPVTVPLSKVIDGWKEGIQGMKVGGRRRLIVPPELAYGSKGVANLIPPDSTLVFEVELCGFER